VACIEIGRSASGVWSPRRPNRSAFSEMIVYVRTVALIDECREPDSVRLRCRKRDEKRYIKKVLSWVRGCWNGSKLLDIFSAAWKNNESYICVWGCLAVNGLNSKQTQRRRTFFFTVFSGKKIRYNLKCIQLFFIYISRMYISYTQERSIMGKVRNVIFRG